MDMKYAGTTQEEMVSTSAGGLLLRQQPSAAAPEDCPGSGNQRPTHSTKDTLTARQREK